jgi:hypothetical protein
MSRSKSLVEKFVPSFSAKWASVGLKHPNWAKRVQLEIVLLSKYQEFQKVEGFSPWITLMPDKDPKYNNSLWRGEIFFSSNRSVSFKIIVLLSSEYPKVPPRCFIEEKIAQYCGKLYLKNAWVDHNNNSKYVMICHDHMIELLGGWVPTHGIVQFLISTVHLWYAGNHNLVLEQLSGGNKTKKSVSTTKVPANSQKKKINEQKRIEKLKKVMNVYTKIQKSEMRKILNLEEEDFNDRLLDWAIKYGFKIEDDMVILEQANVQGFLTALDDQFSDWNEKEQSKDGKIEGSIGEEFVSTSQVTVPKFHCPQCQALVTRSQDQCPNCGSVFNWG